MPRSSYTVRTVVGGVVLVFGPILSAISILVGRATANGALLGIGLLCAAISLMLWIQTAATIANDDGRSGR